MYVFTYLRVFDVLTCLQWMEYFRLKSRDLKETFAKISCLVHYPWGFGSNKANVAIKSFFTAIWVPIPFIISLLTVVIG